MERTPAIYRGSVLSLMFALGIACSSDDASTVPTVDGGPDSTASADTAGLEAGAESDASATADADATAEIEIAGDWASIYGPEQISSTSWGKTKVVSYDNARNVAIRQSPPDDEYTPNKFSKLVWTEPTEGGFHYCTVDFDLDTAEEAEQSQKTADDTDPQNAGCGDFPWTRLFVPLEVRGEWTSNFGEEFSITSTTWGKTTVIKFDNANNFAIAQNPADDEYYPNKFSKLVWTEPSADEFYYCTVDFGKDTASAAEKSEKVADDSDPENSGCGGFSWTKMSAR